jgi:hypothetical protein
LGLDVDLSGLTAGFLEVERDLPESKTGPRLPEVFGACRRGLHKADDPGCDFRQPSGIDNVGSPASGSGFDNVGSPANCSGFDNGHAPASGSGFDDGHAPASGSASCLTA